MTRLYYTNPLAAVKAANKYEAQGYVVDMSVDGDVITLTLYAVEGSRHVA
jgi:hypothetical protein